jgi:hypothetical protein
VTRRCLIHQPGAIQAIRRGEPGVYVCPTDVRDYSVFLAVGEFAYGVFDRDGCRVGEGETMIRLTHLDGSPAEARSAWHLHALRRTYENPDPNTADDLAAMRELGEQA